MSACAFFVYLYVKDVHHSSVRTDKDEVATISFKYRIAQRKYADRVVWEPLSNNSPLYDGDTIRTADLSEAKINFANNVSVEVGENTMFRIAYSSDGQLRVMVDDGNIAIDTTASQESIELQMEGVSLSLESGSRVVAASASNVDRTNFDSLAEKASDSTDTSDVSAKSNRLASFQMLAGNASFKTESGGEQRVSTGESVKVENDGTVTKTPLTVTSIPTNHRVLIFDNGNSPDENVAFVKLEWTTPTELQNDEIIVETSDSRNFDRNIKKQNIKGYSYLLPVRQGITYWRVFCVSDESSYAEGKITSELVKGVQATLPKRNESFFFRSKNPSVNFSWDGNDYASFYHLEVSENADFKNLTIDENVKGRYFSSELAEGSYFWRVTPYYELNGTGFHNPTEKREFAVVKRAEYEKPKIILPQENSKFYYDSENLPFSFSWKSEIKGGSYSVVVARDASFENKIAEFSTSKKSFDAVLNTDEFSSYGDEKLFCKIIQSYTDELEESAGTKIIESVPCSFMVARYVAEKSKLLYPVDGFAVEQKYVTQTNFMWKDAAQNNNASQTKNSAQSKDASQDKNAKNYQCKLQVSKNPDFDSLVFEQAVSGTEISGVNLDSGYYWWRVLDSGGNLTDARKLVILKPLAFPKFDFPKNGQQMVVENNKKIEVRWSDVPESDYYKVVLKNADKDKVLADVTVQDSKFDFASQDLSEKNFENFTISVQPFASETKISPLREGEVATLNFALRSPSCIVLDSVKNKDVIPGLKALREDTTFSWHESLDSAKESEFLLYSLTSRGGEKLIYREKNPKNLVKISRLTPGAYRWTVQATTKDGEDMSAKSVNEFTITEVPLLSKPMGKSPAEKYVMGSQFFKKNRSILFEWNKVNGATDYDFALYQKKDDGSLRKIYEQNGVQTNQIRFRNLTDLDVGTFVWHITAYAHAKDGFTEQHSLESENTFTIDFSLPGKVETVRPGIMYAQ